MSVFENDFIMRQIEDLTNMLGKVFLHKGESEVMEEEQLNSEGVKKYFRKIQKLIEEKKYREAIAVLQNEFIEADSEYLKVALATFDQLNALTKAELAEGNYSRNSLYNDLSFISEKYGIHL